MLIGHWRSLGKGLGNIKFVEQPRLLLFTGYREEPGVEREAALIALIT